MTDRSQSSTTDDPALEPALRHLLDAAQTQTDDPTGIYTVPAQGPDMPAYTIEITAAPTATDISQTARVSYCLDCDWRVSTADYPTQEVSTQLLEHAIETGHDIESATGTDPPAADRIARSGSDD